MTIGGKIFFVLFLIGVSVLFVIGDYWGVEFIRRSVDLAGMDCIRHLVGGFLLTLMSTAALWIFGIAGFMTIMEDYL